MKHQAHATKGWNSVLSLRLEMAFARTTTMVKICKHFSLFNKLLSLPDSKGNTVNLMEETAVLHWTIAGAAFAIAILHGRSSPTAFLLGNKM